MDGLKLLLQKDSWCKATYTPWAYISCSLISSCFPHGQRCRDGLVVGLPGSRPTEHREELRAGADTQRISEDLLRIFLFSHLYPDVVKLALNETTQQFLLNPYAFFFHFDRKKMTFLSWLFQAYNLIWIKLTAWVIVFSGLWAILGPLLMAFSLFVCGSYSRLACCTICKYLKSSKRFNFKGLALNMNSKFTLPYKLPCALAERTAFNVPFVSLESEN